MYSAVVRHVTVRQWHCCLFIQAEDGIRDLVRARGLGDVYKSQSMLGARALTTPRNPADPHPLPILAGPGGAIGGAPVSYTPLPLPTSGLA